MLSEDYFRPLKKYFSSIQQASLSVLDISGSLVSLQFWPPILAFWLLSWASVQSKFLYKVKRCKEGFTVIIKKKISTKKHFFSRV